MDAIAGNVVQGLASFAHEEFKLLCNSKHDVERMKNTVLAIRATLLDAEEKANNNHEVSRWLARLKKVLYDADDLLDDLSTEALRRKIMTQNKVAKKVRIFFSKSNQLVYNLKMAHKLRGVRGTLDEIENDRRQFNLTDQGRKPLSVLQGRKQTGSNVKDEIIGREEEKHIILRYLLDSNVKSSVSVIPIVGFGGLGKTALAQLVYNHDDVKKHFGLKRWVCVSDKFDVGQIGQKILGQGSSKEKDQVEKELGQLVEGNKFLIVLDDVWIEEDVDESWRDLKSLLTKGAEGSMVIVTTRSEMVGKMMGTHPPIILKGLDDERSLELFYRMASTKGGQPNDKELIAIGKEVVEKCGGVPLAIRAVGSLVYKKTLGGITNLSYLRNCELWNAHKSLEERIFAVLKLSYDYLPSCMKNCFAFCSLFPKDFLFKKETLIQMWVAQGFIEPTNTMRSEEDVGNEYFMDLLSRSFFQDVITDDHGDILGCKMHDVIHDLAQFVAKHEYLVIREGRENCTSDTTRHLSCDALRENWEVQPSFVQFQKARTMLLLTEPYGRDYYIVMGAFNFFFDLVVSKFKFLRVLDLHWSKITKIPKSIGRLKHLRFLDLSCNRIMQVPGAITRLHNLQTLNLSYNEICELPRDVCKLVSLRHLHLPDMLKWMPSGLGQLTCLQTLTHFKVVDQEMFGSMGSARINELGELNNLRGTLRISGLKHLRSNPEDAKSARLEEKQHLQQLSLNWGTFDNEYDEFSEFASDDELILERLCPHLTIKALHIHGFYGLSLPDWIGNLSELHYLELSNCKYLRSLPEGLPNLTSLRKLAIIGSPLLADDERQKIAHIQHM